MFDYNRNLFGQIHVWTLSFSIKKIHCKYSSLYLINAFYHYVLAGVDFTRDYPGIS